MENRWFFEPRTPSRRDKSAANMLFPVLMGPMMARSVVVVVVVVFVVVDLVTYLTII